MTIGRYTKKPVTIEAAQWDGTDERSNEIREWVERTHRAGAVVDTDHIQHLWDHDLGAYVMPNGKVIFAPYRMRCLIVLTLEGEMVCRRDSWIIRGVEGEFYPCDPFIFDSTYRPERRPAPSPEAEIKLSRHEYAEDSFIIDHFTGDLLTSRQDLEDLYRQLDDFLYPNPGFEPRIAEIERES
jgi:hypothetical protein